MNSDLNNYLKGILWFFLALLCSVLNDIISKKIGLSLSAAQISFLRSFGSTLALIPFILFTGIKTLKSKTLKIHFLRGILLFCSLSTWVYGLTITSVASVTIISFSIPLITLILANLVLNEDVKWYRWVATILGFIGVIIAIPTTKTIFDIRILVLFLSAFIFAILDIINKKFVNSESMLSMLFYSAFFTTIVALPFAYYSWKPLNYTYWPLIFILGCSANLILYFLLKAFSLVDSSAVAPYRYIELILSAIAGFLYFNETVSYYIGFGGAILIFSTTFIFYTEKANINKH
ncbi:DMT family transporter [Orientia tsutsugamushi]|uniref:S-adenosylmethionine uptake transporter n=1 Tax=Orientia tsutsugamushi TaxID=784 RepID=A0A2U3QW91_ORITS|nr:DMT family transporter [Orientia tsutsugamushi]KJV56154.1 S-adenosylmethionine uptake transporter [Orientia tsutsugamushi str. Kato PP]SPR05237.1 EamA family transporter [Orientia tsutsugamushi]